MGDSDSENEDSECYEDSDANEIDEIEMKYFDHIEELKKIKIEGHCLLKKTLIKCKLQTDTDSEREKYTYEDYCDRCSTHCAHYVKNWRNWRHFRLCEEILDIKKMNTRYVCSKDRLDAIDFKIIYDYQNRNEYDQYHYYDKYIKVNK